MPRLPTGAVSLLFTDIEGSTRLLQERQDDYAEMLCEHRRTLRETCARHQGVEVDTQGDAFFFVFERAGDAVAAAERAQRVLAEGPIRVRMGIHTGNPQVTDDGYVGIDIHRAARICAAAHGGQVVLSESTRSHIGASFTVTDLGLHRLKDLGQAERLFQIGERAFPPLRSLNATNLPAQPSLLIGRDREVAEVSALVLDHRLVTLTGPGGSGKTRVALQVAADLVGEFKDGVFWVPLGAVTDADLVLPTVAATLGAKVALAEHIDEKRMLLLLDNLEQLIRCAPAIAELLARCPNLRLLVTSRAVLRLSGEREYEVPPLSQPDAVALFTERAAQTEPLEAVQAICRRLDGLPLAIELAAARTRVLRPDKLLERLDKRLPLLTSGPRDAPERQRTLRATIEWSYGLLSAEERQLFASLAVFRGSFDLDAAEDVCDADLSSLDSLVEQSMLRRSAESRFFYLETIHESALERMEEREDATQLRRRHADYFHQLAVRLESALRAGEPEEGPVSTFATEIDNVRAAVAFGLECGDARVVREITAALVMYWLVRGLHVEARAWLERALALDEAEDQTRRLLLSGLATIAYGQGHHALAVSSSDAAAALAMKLGGVTEQFDLLKEQARATLLRGDIESAEALFTEAQAVAEGVDNGVGTSSCRLNLAYLANRTGRYDRARELLEENLPFVRSRGQSRCEAYTMAGFGATAITSGLAQNAGDYALSGARRAASVGDQPLVAFCVDQLAAAAAARGELGHAAKLLAATDTARNTMGVEPDDDERAIREWTMQRLGRDEGVVQAWKEGRTLSLDAVLALVEPPSSPRGARRHSRFAGP
jgi:predicted ATPase/class 3 adenylate cyclase